MKKMTLAQLAIGMVCMIMVYAVTCQINSVKINDKVKTPEKIRVEDLQNQLTNEKAKNADILSQLLESQRSLEAYRTEATSKGELNTVMKEELDKARLLAGMTEVEGQGVVVVLTDSTKPASEIQKGSYEEYIVHDGDLRMVTTELAGAGAEAMSINGQRIISTTAIRCVGNTIMVNDVKVAPPFEIQAVGDPNTLEAALLIKGGVSDYLKSWNVNISVKKSSKLQIPRYTGVINFKYATPVIEEGGAKK
ncbi:MAG: DUF881 domain-containing protein [Clostridia bacterium]|nr:DUF881 domain-containing protein [Clostridia bacterium]